MNVIWGIRSVVPQHPSRMDLCQTCGGTFKTPQLMRIHIQVSIGAFFWTIFFVINYLIFRSIMKAPRLSATPVKKNLKGEKSCITIWEPIRRHHVVFAGNQFQWTTLQGTWLHAIKAVKMLVFNVTNALSQAIETIWTWKGDESKQKTCNWPPPAQGPSEYLNF